MSKVVKAISPGRLFKNKIFKKLAPFDPIANVVVSGSLKGLVDPTASIISEMEKAAEKDAAAREQGVSVAGSRRAHAVDDRRGRLESSAAAAGAVRGGNEADILGIDKYQIKRKGAARTLLG